MLLFSCFLISGACETFQFEAPGRPLSLRLVLDPHNISTGFFVPEEPKSNLTYNVAITSPDGQKTFFKKNMLPFGDKTYFSFSNDVKQHVILSIEPVKVKEDEPSSPGFISMKFKSKPDTFNKDVSKEKQIVPAIFTLEKLLKRENELIKLTQDAAERLRKLGESSRSTTWLVLIYNIATPVFYLILSVWQIKLLKNHLQKKKL